MVYNVKGPTHPTIFPIFDGPLYTYDRLKNGNISLQQVENQQKNFRKELNEITSGKSTYKSNILLYVTKMSNIFITQDKKLLIY